MGRRHEVTDASREAVKTMFMAGSPWHRIAKVLGVSERTARARYADERIAAMAELDRVAGGSLHRLAAQGSWNAIAHILRRNGALDERVAVEPETGGGGGLEEEQERWRRLTSAELAALDAIRTAANARRTRPAEKDSVARTTGGTDET